MILAYPKKLGERLATNSPRTLTFPHTWLDSERQRFLTMALAQESNNQDPFAGAVDFPDFMDNGMGVGAIPPLRQGEIRIAPSFIPSSSLNLDHLTSDAQLNLSASSEYQSLLLRLNAVAGDVIARSTQFDLDLECPRDEEAATAHVFDAIPSPGRKRNAQGDFIQSGSKKRPPSKLTLLPPLQPLFGMILLSRFDLRHFQTNCPPKFLPDPLCNLFHLRMLSPPRICWFARDWIL